MNLKIIILSLSFRFIRNDNGFDYDDYGDDDDDDDIDFSRFKCRSDDNLLYNKK